MNKLSFHSRAQRDFDDAFGYYEERNPVVADRFSEEVRRKLLLIEKFPLRYPKRNGLYRETTLKGFPFVLVYTHNSRKNTVVISSIYHTSRNPKSKYRR